LAESIKAVILWYDVNRYQYQISTINEQVINGSSVALTSFVGDRDLYADADRVMHTHGQQTVY
jgi:hypothetical protein